MTTTQRLQRVCVVGAGLSGLACALAAARRRRQVTLLEAAPSPAAALPGAVDVPPTMLRDLVALGLGDDCVRVGFPYRGVDVLGRNAQPLQRRCTEPLAGARYPAALGMRRTDLLALLERAAVAAGVQLRRGQRVPALEDSDILTAKGSARADLLLLAVGADSALRRQVFPVAAPVQPLGQR